MSRGGVRKGAGRPKSRPDTMMVRVPVETAAKIKRYALARGIRGTQAVQELVDFSFEKGVWFGSLTHPQEGKARK